MGMFLSVPITVVLQIACENIPALRPLAILMESGQVQVVKSPSILDEKSE
jgi:predicted PurR-regulated permease PerM